MLPRVEDTIAGPDGYARIAVTAAPDPAETAGILALVAAATGADSVAPLSEHSRLLLRGGPAPGVHHLLLYSAGSDAGRPGATGEEPAGYGVLEIGDEGGVAEFFVDPARRRRGHGRRLLAESIDLAGPGGLRVWAHGRSEAAVALAAAAGLAQVRVLMRMVRPLDATLPPVQLPAGVTVRAFRPGEDDEAWLGVNARAFSHHPEQGAWTAADLAARLAEPWFDPQGFFVAEAPDGGVIGFHWTKVDVPRPGEPAVGEVYVVAVDPGEHRPGLGTALTLTGLHHLRARGLAHVMLYVDGDNPRALAVYRRLGFTEADVDVMFAHPGT